VFGHADIGLREFWRVPFLRTKNWCGHLRHARRQRREIAALKNELRRTGQGSAGGAAQLIRADGA
jgi:hypothetical protein